jgi:putative DNA methylase
MDDREKATHGPVQRPLDVSIELGRTTTQILAWGYASWADLLTPRHQALIAHLAAAIRRQPDPALQAWLTLTVSAALDFMTTLCSFRGPRFGAVRTAAAHHVLRPPLIALENNPLGPPDHSGTLARIFTTRILPALPSTPRLTTDASDVKGERGRCYIYHGTSALAPVPEGLVDVVVTDPPYFDKIFYQDLAQIYVAFLGEVGIVPDGQKAMREAALAAVEHEESAIFEKRLGEVWRRCARSLRPGGVLAFSFRSSAPSAWVALARSLVAAGMMCYRAEPAHSEVAKSLTKAWARYPSTLDIMLFCRHGEPAREGALAAARTRVEARSRRAERRLQVLGHQTTPGDRLLVRCGGWVVEATTTRLDAADPWARVEDELVAVTRRVAHKSSRHGDLAARAAQAEAVPEKGIPSIQDATPAKEAVPEQEAVLA